jgi:hypothetical protein
VGDVRRGPRNHDRRGRAAGGVVVFAVSDGDEPVRDAAWIRRLNPAARADRFARWVGAPPDGTVLPGEQLK